MIKPTHRRLEDRVALSEFCDCAGAMVARVVRHAVPAGSRDGSTTYTLIEWRSDDLGDNVPTDGDFIIDLGEDTMVIGFAKSVERGDIRRLDIDDIKLADLDTTGGARPPKGAPVSSTTRPRWGGSALVLVLFNLMLAATLMRLWARLRKGRAE